jgi:hypothetical protein
VVLAALFSLVALSATPALGADAAAPAGPAASIEARTLELPPTRPRISLDFPIDLGRRIALDAADLLSAPARWDGADWAKFSLFAVVAGGLFAADRTIDVASRQDVPRSATESRMEDALEQMGSGPGVLSVVGGSAVLGWLRDDDAFRSLAIDAGESALLSSGFTAFLKEATGRARARRGNGPYDFHPFSGSASFPSGHATAAFALASAVSEEFENPPQLVIPAYGLATIVALCRMRAGAHFASDVFVGAAIGTATARTVTALERHRRERAKGAPGGASVSIVPTMYPSAVGLTLAVRF